MLAEVDALGPAEREKMLAAVAWDAIETNQEIAHEAFGKMSPGSPEKIRLIQHYAMRLAAQNMDEAIEKAEALENETEKSAALSDIAVALAETNPQLTWLQYASPEIRSELEQPSEAALKDVGDNGVPNPPE